MSTEFKYIRNQIRKYTRESLVLLCIQKIKHLEGRHQKTYPIWSIFTLLKWAFIYAGDKYPSQNASSANVEKLIELIWELSNSYRATNLTNKEKLPKYISAISKQQFWLQQDFHISIIYRQIAIYQKLKSKYCIESSFQNLTGISISDFLNCCFITECYIQQNLIGKSHYYTGQLFNDYFDLLTHKISNIKADKFWNLLKLGSKESIDFLKLENKKITFGLFQTYDTEWISRFPFIEIDGVKTIIHKNIFTNTINHFLYDYLKANDSKFPEEFGKRLEKYIELGLKEISADYITEKNIKRTYPNAVKQVDFIVDSHILIESKAIELKSISAIIPDKEILVNSLKDSIIKAYSQQMLTTCNSLPNSTEFFGIIITYKQLEIGNGNICWDTFLKDSTLEYCRTNRINHNLLPPQNLFIMDIQTWDKIIQIVKDGKATLYEILVKARRENEDVETMKFYFFMHLSEYEPIHFNLSYLIAANDLLL